jgi:carbonic anhydrase
MNERVSADAALIRLQEGNQRFIKGVRSVHALAGPELRPELVASQNPFAIVLSCADSRVPSEMVFDCGLGDLFVCRVAGNIAAPSIVGSVEFAASKFGTELVVVMGHTRCGAISATLDSIDGVGDLASDNIRDLVDRIAPAVAELDPLRFDKEARWRAAMRANVRSAASHLRHGSRLLERLVGEGRVHVVGAEYELETGEVHFFDGVGNRPRTA